MNECFFFIVPLLCAVITIYSLSHIIIIIIGIVSTVPCHTMSACPNFLGCWLHHTRMYHTCVSVVCRDINIDTALAHNIALLSYKLYYINVAGCRFQSNQIPAFFLYSSFFFFFFLGRLNALTVTQPFISTIISRMKRAENAASVKQAYSVREKALDEFIDFAITVKTKINDIGNRRRELKLISLRVCVRLHSLVIVRAHKIVGYLSAGIINSISNMW